MQQTYPTNIVAHIELLISVKVFVTVNFVDFPAPQRLGSAPGKKKPMTTTNSSVNSWLRWPTKALPCQTQSQLGCGSWYFRFVQYVSTLGLCGFLTYLFKLRLVGQSSSTCLFDSCGGIPYPTGLSRSTRDWA
jgi:hypothetical protein